MPIELNCPGCGKQLRLADEHAGKAGRCPACQATFQIPTAAEQAPSSPFGSGSGPAQPFGSSPGFPQHQAPPAANPFGGQNPPNPFASTSGMPSPYGGVNPYSSPQTQNMYGGTPSSPGEGTATASMILGIVSIIFSFIPCCCMNLWIGGLCGVIGLVLAFQVPPERRKVGMILNIVGLSICALTVVGAIIWYAMIINEANNNGQFN